MRYWLALAALFSSAAFAVDVTVRWTNPTQYTDNTPLAASDITQTRIEYGSCVGTAFGAKQGEAIEAGSGTSKVIPNIAPGTHCFRLYTSAKGQESTASIVASKVIAQPPPKPPTLTTVDTVAFGIKIERNKFALVKVGTVPRRVACDAKQAVNGYHVVPRWTVRFSGSNRPEAVVARCG